MTLDSHNIIPTVSQVYGVSESDILGRSREQPIAEARQMAMYLYNLGGFSKVETGRIFGVSHVAVIYAIKHIKDFIRIDKAVARKYNEIIERL